MPPRSGRLMWDRGSFSSPTAVGSTEQTLGCCLVLQEDTELMGSPQRSNPASLCRIPSAEARL